MESENDTETDAPARLITVNQVVAWNIAWFRREAGLTQAELAARLGWPQNKVSEAERSWNGKRTREFDAQTLIALSLALGVPLNAFFIPPPDDGKEVTYRIRPPGQREDLGMTDLLAAVLYGEPDDGSEVMESYRQRLLDSTERYLGEDWRAVVARWVRKISGRDALFECIQRLQGGEPKLLAALEFIDELAEAMKKAAEEEDE